MSLASIRASDPTAAWCIARTLPLEGGLVDHPADPGGVTNHGVSLRWALQEVSAHADELSLLDVDHDGDVDRQDIRGLTVDTAADVFYTCWWKPGWYQKLSVATIEWKTFDIGVNTGPKRAGIILQRALVSLGSNSIVVDGNVGPMTLNAARTQTANDDGVALLIALRQNQAAFYRGLASLKPELNVFLGGWLNRAAA